MRFDTVIRNATVVTATDTYRADVGLSGDRVSAIAAQLPAENSGRVIDATGLLLIPGGIDVHTHLDMPFGGTTSSDDFETGTIAAAFGGTTTLIDFAIQYKGQSLRQAFDTWMTKAHDKAVTDYAFHCIITDLGSAQLEEMSQLIRDGVTSFKLFMAYPGVFMLDDATIFKAMRQAAEHNGLICMHAENGGAIDVIVQQALAEGKRAPKYHSLDPPPPKPKPLLAPSRLRKWPARLSTSCTSPATTRSKKSAKRATAACPPTPRRVRNTCICPSTTSRRRASKARSMFSRRRCVKSGIRKNSGKASRKTRCRSSRPTIARSASKSKRNSARTTSPRFPTAARASSTASVWFTPAASTASISRRTGLSSSFPQRPQNSLAFTRARALSPSARTPISSSSIPITKKSSARKRTTCAWIIPCSRASRSKARRKPSFPVGARSSTRANSSAVPARGNSSAASPTPAYDYSLVVAPSARAPAFTMPQTRARGTWEDSTTTEVHDCANAISGHRRTPQRGQVRTFQPFDGYTPLHRHQRARHHPRPHLRQGGMARQDSRGGGHRRHRS